METVWTVVGAGDGGEDEGWVGIGGGGVSRGLGGGFGREVGAGGGGGQECGRAAEEGLH